jgi:protein-tyrosine phosphatase
MNLYYNEIIPGLFLGSFDARITKVGETSPLIFDEIIEISSLAEKNFYIQPEGYTMSTATLTILHSDQEPSLSQFFDLTTNRIKEALATGKKVLVHCGAGISRSPTIVAAYLCSTGLTVDEAINKIKVKRPKINPWAGFVSELKERYN